MAKSLPYFKFFCSEWTDGDITLENYETQGLFVNICAYYWSNECIVELSKLKKKFRGYELLIDEIIASNLIKMKDSFISISFLNEQFNERINLSKQNSKNIKDYWEKKRTLSENNTSVIRTNNERNTNVQIPLNESDSIKRREDNIIEDNNKTTITTYTIDKSIEICLRDLEWIDASSKSCNLDKDKYQYAFNDFKQHCISSGSNEDRTIKDFKYHFVNWVKKKKDLKAKETVKDRL